MRRFNKTYSLNMCYTCDKIQFLKSNIFMVRWSEIFCGVSICLHKSSRYFFLSGCESLCISFVKNSYSISSIFETPLLFFSFRLADLMEYSRKSYS